MPRPEPQPAPDDILAEGAMYVNDAVKFASIGRTELYEAMARGELPYVQRGKRRLIPRRALVALLRRDLVPGNQEDSQHGS